VGILSPHLGDAAFAEIWSERLTIGDAAINRPAERHLQACGECRSRFAAFTTWMEGLRMDALAEADEAFGAERLGAQQAQVFRRLEALEHPARVITFPSARPIAAQQSQGRRWVAAAAAAGLVVGLGLGQMLDFGTTPIREAESTGRQVAQNLPAEPPRMAVQPASYGSDEAFLDHPDLAPSQVRVPESLQYLNAITPGARDSDPR
jgi:hypothetical protein